LALVVPFHRVSERHFPKSRRLSRHHPVLRVCVEWFLRRVQEPDPHRAKTRAEGRIVEGMAPRSGRVRFSWHGPRGGGRLRPDPAALSGDERARALTRQRRTDGGRLPTRVTTTDGHGRRGLPWSAGLPGDSRAPGGGDPTTHNRRGSKNDGHCTKSCSSHSRILASGADAH
jgi:hypothetical protein